MIEKNKFYKLIKKQNRELVPHNLLRGKVMPNKRKKLLEEYKEKEFQEEINALQY